MRTKFFIAAGVTAIALLISTPKANAQESFSFGYSSGPSYTHYSQQTYYPVWHDHWRPHRYHHRRQYCNNPYRNPHSRFNGHSRHDRRYW